MTSKEGVVHGDGVRNHLKTPDWVSTSAGCGFDCCPTCPITLNLWGLLPHTLSILCVRCSLARLLFHTIKSNTKGHEGGTLADGLLLQ